jgi:hypothetical protein
VKPSTIESVSSRSIIECDIIGLWLMIRLTYFGSMVQLKVLPVVPELQLEDKSNGCG